MESNKTQIISEITLYEYGLIQKFNCIHTLLILSLLFAVYTGSGDTIARMFEAKSGTLKRTFKGHENAIVCVEVRNHFY